MANIFRKHQKRIVKLAGVALLSFLMVAFLLPDDFGRGMGGPDPVVAMIGDVRVRHSQVSRARWEWEMLKTVQHRLPGGEFYPLVLIRLAPGQVAEPIISEIDRNEPMYFLLLEEGRRMGIQPSEDELRSLEQQVFSTRLDPDVPAERDELRRILANFLVVEGAYNRIASIVKVSDPFRQTFLAQELQSIRANLVEFLARDFDQQVPTPDEQQLQEHFQQYASLPPGQPDPRNNPFGFGYRHPDRVALQYIAVARPDVRQAILATRDEHDWEVAARRYYIQNQQEFATTEPAPLPSAPLTLGVVPPLAVNPETGPRVREFWEVRDQILDRLITPQVDRRLTAIQTRIRGTMSDDFVAWQRAAEQNGAPPATSLNVPYPNYEYLQRLASEIQREHDVLPHVASFAEPMSADELQEISGFSHALHNNIPAPVYLTGFVRPFVEEQFRDHPEVIEVLQPTPPLRLDDTVYFARVTEALPSQPPPELAEVRDRVETDLRLKLAYDLARQQAQQLLDSAQQGRLAEAAQQAGVQLIETGHFQGGSPVPGYTLPRAANVDFAREAFKLLSLAAETGQDHPIRLIELPSAGRVIVAELQEVQALWTEQTHYLAEGQAAAQLAQIMEQPLRMQWFDYNSLVSRTGYEPRRLDNGMAEEDPDPVDPLPPPMPVGR
jgi:hypothetical protein